MNKGRVGLLAAACVCASWLASPASAGALAAAAPDAAGTWSVTLTGNPASSTDTYTFVRQAGSSNTYTVTNLYGFTATVVVPAAGAAVKTRWTSPATSDHFDATLRFKFPSDGPATFTGNYVQVHSDGSTGISGTLKGKREAPTCPVAKRYAKDKCPLRVSVTKFDGGPAQGAEITVKGAGASQTRFTDGAGSAKFEVESGKLFAVIADGGKLKPGGAKFERPGATGTAKSKVIMSGVAPGDRAKFRLAPLCERKYADFFGVSGTVSGTSSDDVLWGRGPAVVSGRPFTEVSGQGGDDLLCSDAGAVGLDGGSGDDRLFGSHVDGGRGNDAITLRPADPADTAVGSGGPGDDTITGTKSPDIIGGDEGDDALIGGAGNDTIAGGSGDDDIRGDGGGTIRFPQRLDGGPGDDVIRGGSGADVISGDAPPSGDPRKGNTFNATPDSSESDRDVLFGGAGDDAIGGAKDVDFLDGGAGRDYLFGYGLSGFNGPVEQNTCVRGEVFLEDVDPGSPRDCQIRHGRPPAN